MASFEDTTDDYEKILKHCQGKVAEYQSQFFTRSEDQNVVSLPQKQSTPGEFVNVEDPDTPPVTPDVEAMREIYRDVIDLLFNENNYVLSSFSTFGDTDVADADPFAWSILQLFRTFGLHLRLLRRMIDREVAITTGVTTVFRRNSMCTKMMTAFASLTGQRYLEQILAPICRDIEASSEDLEIDEIVLRSRNADSSSVPSAVILLISRCQQVLDAIVNNMESVPGSFRYLAYMLQFYVKQRWPEGGDEPWYKAIAGFFFLRFVCPSLVAPEKHNMIIAANPDGTARRKFVLIAKVMQNLANDTSFSQGNEAWTPIDDWLKSNSERIVTLYRTLATPPTSFLPLTHMTPVSSLDIVKALFTLHQMTKLKMRKMVRLLEDKKVRDNNLLTGDTREIIRDVQTFFAALAKHADKLKEQIDKGDKHFKVDGFSQKAFNDALKEDEQLFSAAKEHKDGEMRRFFTLNVIFDPDDLLFKKAGAEELVPQAAVASSGMSYVPTRSTTSNLAVSNKSLSGSVKGDRDKERKEKDREKEKDKDKEKERDTSRTRDRDDEGDAVSLVSTSELHPVTLVTELLKELGKLLVAHSKNLPSLRVQDSFRALAMKCARFQRADVSALKENEKKAFWLNLFHLLFLHTCAVVGSPVTLLQRAAFYTIFKYQIGAFTYSLVDIQTVLRGNHGNHWEKTDPRKAFLLPLDARVHGALCLFTITSPDLAVYEPASVDKALDGAMSKFVEKYHVVNMEDNTLLLPKIFEWYEDDFRVLVAKKHGKKYALDSHEWVRHLVDMDIGQGDEQILDNPYMTLKKITKTKPTVAFLEWQWTPQYNFDAFKTPLPALL